MADPSTQYTPKLSLEQLYEGTVLDNDMLNANWQKIEAALTDPATANVLVNNSDKIDGYHIMVESSLPTTVTNGALCFVYES